jgi:RimJ/RimL family protein N-acetyltransferase
MNRNEIELLPAGEQDAGFLFELCADPRVAGPLSLGTHDPEYWRAAVRDWANDPDEEALIVHFVPGRARIGWIALNGLLNPDHVVWVKMMALLPEVWRKGYCRACMDLIKQRAAGRHSASIRLWTDSNNAPALRCYGASGFVRIREDERSVGEPPQVRIRTLLECALVRKGPAGNLTG